MRGGFDKREGMKENLVGEKGREKSKSYNKDYCMAWTGRKSWGGPGIAR